MKNIIIIAAFALLASAASGETIQIRLNDDNSFPLSGAEVKVIFASTLADGSRDSVVRLQTDERGYCLARGKAEFDITVFVAKTGYYDLRVERIKAGKDHDLTLYMRQQRSPIPLYARHIGRFGATNSVVPRHGEWVGFDFEMADWLPPHGGGKTVDIQFRFRNEFLGWKPSQAKLDEFRRIHRNLDEDKFREAYGKWDAELDISFPGAKEGLFEETRFLPYSRMKLPHEAPLDGYVPTWRYTVKSYAPRTARTDVGFFVRTRVKLDDKGNVISANYAKIIGDIYLDPNGALQFLYYFNPVPNVRNLEFALNRNLFPSEPLKGTNIWDP